MKHHQDIGFILIKLLNNQLYNSILTTIAEFIQNRPYNQNLVFNSYCESLNTMNIPILHLQQAQFFDGTLVLFDLPSVLLSNKFPNVRRRFLLTAEAHWTHTTNAPFKQWQSIYNQNNLDIIVNSPILYDIYNICWKRPIATVEDFTYEQLQQYI